ncbi:dethiobiotin synthase [Gallaecimonas sp. GXIMD4217]|uniref:dethiobiotin synthase n=1 Tax=Gallaecimonas sp. GXIMD4217 TaxID=3131927 RepID=UPI00311B014C
MAKTLFITGTDTDAGKTHLGCAILAGLKARGVRAAGLKPVASGGRGDAERLWRHSGLQLGLDEHNPWHFEPAIAPHLAARQAGRPLSLAALKDWFGNWRQSGADVLLVEGAGGWRVPLNDDESFADLAKALEAEVVLVVGMKLGCINHALLTAEAILADGLVLKGWIANAGLGEMACLDDNLAYLEARMPAPLLGVAGHCADPAGIRLEL